MCCFKLPRAYSTPFNYIFQSNVGDFFWNRILKDCLSLKKKLENRCLAFLRPLENVKSANLHDVIDMSKKD